MDGWREGREGGKEGREGGRRARPGRGCRSGAVTAAPTGNFCSAASLGRTGRCGSGSLLPPPPPTQTHTHTNIPPPPTRPSHPIFILGLLAARAVTYAGGAAPAAAAERGAEDPRRSRAGAAHRGVNGREREREGRERGKEREGVSYLPLSDLGLACLRRDILKANS